MKKVNYSGSSKVIIRLCQAVNDLIDGGGATVNDGVLTIQKNGTDVQTFSANQSTNATANITVPTNTSDLNNDSGFIDSSALSSYAPLNSPDFTGTPTTTNPSVSDKSARIASTKYVKDVINNSVFKLTLSIPSHTVGASYVLLDDKVKSTTEVASCECSDPSVCSSVAWSSASGELTVTPTMNAGASATFTFWLVNNY